MKHDTPKPEPVVIKKYANRRLYDTQTSAYITLEDLCERVKGGQDFVVVDAKTGHDLTRQILTQIVFEQETKGLNVLPTEFLRSVIRFYDDNMTDILQHYLDASMKTFMGNQERMRSMIGKTMGQTLGGGIDGLSPLNQLEELTRQNVAFFEKTMSMFAPFGGIFHGAEKGEEGNDEDYKPTKPTGKK
jgi:polyhydroxyalkanoate synthesis repressor PhaR